MDRYVSWEVALMANKWQSRNALRWRNDAYDRLYREAEGELDPVKRTALFIRMNDLVCRDGYLVPLMFRLERQRGQPQAAGTIDRLGPGHEHAGGLAPAGLSRQMRIREGPRGPPGRLVYKTRPVFGTEQCAMPSLITVG
ncbi:MAG: hypothetical protein Q8R98_21745 [Rubrivivax sp.]|nr:hypothetical protein [Rubrivivax sp.]MDP3222672.1 hypothetical protein [Rubrivivax sp.]MDP3614476.1 hypothetical protein [Rubrivivax sp.]